MRRLPIYCFVLLVLLSLAGFIYASSTQAYQDYLYQFDVYRQKYSDFQVAKNSYDKFKTLESQTTALEKTKIMLAQRDQVLRAYLLLLNEELGENQGLNPTTKQTYQTLLNNEVKFLDSHSQLIPAVGSINDAQTVSTQLESHYIILQTSMRQIIIGLSLGNLAILSAKYDTLLQNAKAIILTQGSIFPQDKLNTINRWVLQITDKRSLYQQKINQISSANTQLQINDLQELTRRFDSMTSQVGEAKQYLLEGTSYLGELANALRYQD
ncbi:hypothetical protein A2Z00_00555 [Candidatus Gottesmanbacteria bacterium RBG_13_45_10]|uniref:HBM domain-containing protein n=1 Tax=Candidatus Gottesmanbacteria bacterium RBG_13_45_10 TaxID=1798370 RepID=A0A1F5ZFX8_9BACT|nr:MAG: hypothetical protein A2Z00_00555 [Candidatus Gottesmanbacteria bacterium RBG_13_45_10]